MRKQLVAGGLVVTFLLAGCGDSGGADDDDDDGGGSSGPVALGSFGARTAQYICRVGYACCTAEERGAGAPATEAECRLGYAAFLQLAGDEIAESVAAGRIRYDGVAYGNCLTQALGALCTGTEAFDACVEGVTTPLVQTGGGCQQQGECIGSACLGGDSSANADGVCGTPLPLGAACSEGGECATGSCPFGSCEAKAANGVECFDDGECQSDFCDGNTFTCEAETPNVCD